VVRRFFLATVLGLLALAARAQDPERAPFITTPDEVVERMLALAGTGPNDTVIDLGSGDGRIVLAAVRKHGARGLGIEIDPRLVALSRERAKAAGLAGRAEFVEGDVLRADLSRGTVITVYLLPSLLDRLQPRFLELRPGTRIVAHAFPMVGWRPDRSETMRIERRHEGQGHESTLRLWIVPAQARGRWQASAPQAGGEWRIAIHQNFQEIEVEGSAGGRTLQAREAKLEGEAISWHGTLTLAGRATPYRYRGRVQGDRIAGELQIDGAPALDLGFRR
jgi:SAM-dependent methyltransferase